MKKTSFSTRAYVMKNGQLMIPGKMEQQEK